MNGDVTRAQAGVQGQQRAQEEHGDQDQDLVDGVFRHVLADPEPVLPSTVDFAVLGGRRKVRRRRIAQGAGTAALVVVAVFGAGALLGQHRQAAATTGVSRSRAATPSATRSPSAAASPSATPSLTTSSDPTSDPTSANVQQTHPSTLGTDTSTGSPATSSAASMMSSLDAGTAGASPTASSNGNSNGTAVSTPTP